MIKKNNNQKPPVTNGDDLKSKTEKGIKWKALLTSQPPSTSPAEVLVTESCSILCNPMDCRPPGSSVHGILQAGILEWITIPFSRESSQPRNQVQVSCLADRFFTFWVTREDLQRSQVSLAHSLCTSFQTFPGFLCLSVHLFCLFLKIVVKCA